MSLGKDIPTHQVINSGRAEHTCFRKAPVVSLAVEDRHCSFVGWGICGVVESAEAGLQQNKQLERRLSVAHQENMSAEA